MGNLGFSWKRMPENIRVTEVTSFKDRTRRTSHWFSGWLKDDAPRTCHARWSRWTHPIGPTVG